MELKECGRGYLYNTCCTCSKYSAEAMLAPQQRAATCSEQTRQMQPRVNYILVLPLPLPVDAPLGGVPGALAGLRGAGGECTA